MSRALSPLHRFAVWSALLVASPAAFGAGQSAGPSLIQVDARQLVSRADLHYTTPVARSEEGMPIGNGRMGSLVWTTPSALKFQINRVDVFAMDGRSFSFPEADSDYASGCGYVDIHLATAGPDVFAGDAFQQHLSLHDALMTAKGAGVTARVLAWTHDDVIAVEIDDQRRAPEPIAIDLRMLRYQIQRITGKNHELASTHAVAFQTAEHTATSTLGVRDGRITLTQQFEERDFHDSSAVAIGVLGRASKARYLNESTVQLAAAPGRGKFTILISSAASFDRATDTAALALRKLDAASARQFAGLQADTAAWWRDFWSRGFVAMRSESKQAEFVESNYTYFLYLMGATSRGDYPPRFGGMLWYTNGDMRRWGSQYWWANQQAYYHNLMPANRLELMDPLIAMYFNMRDATALAAKQQWGSQGIFIPEISYFNGPEPLPEDIAAELQDLYLVRKPYEDRSEKFQRFIEKKTRHAARWNFLADGKWENGHWVVPTKGAGIFGHCTHILASGPRIAALFWDRYLHTRDETFLRDRAYPMIRDTAEFYRNFPNLKKEADGKYHLHHVNNNEGGWNSSDTPLEIAAMHMIFGLAVHASEILNVDPELRRLWREVDEHLAPPRASGRGARPEEPRTRPVENELAGAAPRPPAPTTAAPPPEPRPGEASYESRRSPLTPGFARGAYAAFVYGGPGAIEPIGPEPELKRRFLGFNRTGGFIDEAGIGGAQIFRNRMRLREGPGAIDAEHIGGLTMGIHSTMLSSGVDVARGDEPLRLFTGWPKDWDAAFTLRAHGAFVIGSAQIAGAVPLVEIRSEAGARCRLVNPWGAATAVTIWRRGAAAENLTGATLEFPTARGETIVLAPAGAKPARVEMRL